MIKRFVFASSQHAALASKLRRVPAALRPLRAVVCSALQADTDGVSIEWFANVDALQRYRSWEREHDLQPSAAEVIAQEVVLRGAEWLAQRWKTLDPKFKHMALARRAPGLTAAEFSERWRNRPGQIGGGQNQSLAIPEAAKGQAYCQNHPLPDSQSPYDAINEVYFDQLEDMRPRIEFFRDHPVARLDADLVSEPRFLIVREDPI